MECPVRATSDDFIRTLGVVLTKIVADVVPEYSSITCFNSINAPPISDYLVRIARYVNCSNECFVLALVYIDRIMKLHKLSVSVLNIHRLLITSVMLAAKFSDDVYYSNSFYAQVGGIKVAEINQLEAQFLMLIKYQLFVNAKDYENCRKGVESSSTKICKMPENNEARKGTKMIKCPVNNRFKQNNYQPNYANNNGIGGVNGFNGYKNKNNGNGCGNEYINGNPNGNVNVNVNANGNMYNNMRPQYEVNRNQTYKINNINMNLNNININNINNIKNININNVNNINVNKINNNNINVNNMIRRDCSTHNMNNYWEGKEKNQYANYMAFQYGLMEPFKRTDSTITLSTMASESFEQANNTVNQETKSKFDECEAFVNALENRYRDTLKRKCSNNLGLEHLGLVNLNNW